MSITINGSGTIGGVSVGGLPDGIVDTDMLASNAVTSALLPAGSVLQVVQATYSTTTTIANTNTSNYYQSGHSVSITPSSTSSKILVIAQGTYGGNTGSTGINIKIFRNSGTATTYTSYIQGYLNNITYLSYQQIPFTLITLDSPSTTSATTYQTWMNPNHGTPTGNSYLGGRNNDGLQTSNSTIMALEIAG